MGKRRSACDSRIDLTTPPFIPKSGSRAGHEFGAGARSQRRREEKPVHRSHCFCREPAWPSQIRRMFMKAILVLVALSTIAAAPALAHRASPAHHGAHAARQQRLPPAAPPGPDFIISASPTYGPADIRCRVDSRGASKCNHETNLNGVGDDVRPCSVLEHVSEIDAPTDVITGLVPVISIDRARAMPSVFCRNAVPSASRWPRQARP